MHLQWKMLTFETDDRITCQPCLMKSLIMTRFKKKKKIKSGLMDTRKERYNSVKHCLLK